ncbi:winged helix-turn-helix domain-containing protein [Streptomyces capparidis]
MGYWVVGADTLAGSRFVLSPLAETTACLLALDRAEAAHPGERAWLAAHLPAYRERLARDPVTAALARSALGRRWLADFLAPAPGGEREETFEEEVARVGQAPPEVARADVRVALGGGLPAELADADLPATAARLLEWVWRRAVAPSWDRRRRILQADVVARTAGLGRGGWAEVLGDLRPGMRWLGGDRLMINTQDNPPRKLAGARLLFVPVTPRQSWTAWELPHRYALVYPCAGALAETGPAAVAPGALGRALGPGRATVLALLGEPKSTTQLVALTGLGLGSVGRHLRVLLDARLVERRRAGRSVLYYRTAVGEALVRAQDEG